MLRGVSWGLEMFGGVCRGCWNLELYNLPLRHCLLATSLISHLPVPVP